MTDPTDPWDPASCLRCRSELALPGLPVGLLCEREYVTDEAVRLVVDLVADGWSPEELYDHRALQDRAAQVALADLQALWRSAR